MLISKLLRTYRMSFGFIKLLYNNNYKELIFLAVHNRNSAQYIIRLSYNDYYHYYVNYPPLPLHVHFLPSNY